MSRREAQAEFRDEWLRRKHASLDERVNELSTRPYLTSEEALELNALKRAKLAAKDQLSSS